MRNLWVGLLGGAALMVTGAGSANAGLVIDDFSVPTDTAGTSTTTDSDGLQDGILISGSGNPSVNSFDDGTDTSGGATSGILGGERDVILSSAPDVGTSPSPIQATFTILAGSGGFSGVASLSTSDNFLSTLELQYDGNDNSAALDTTGLGGVDLTDSGVANAFVFTVVSNDQGGLVPPQPIAVITVYDLDGTVATFTQPFLFTVGDASNDDADPGLQAVALFSAFTETNAGGTPGLDFTNIGAITFVIDSNGVDSVDLSVDLIETIPEPGTLGLFGTGLLALGWYARRQHRRRTAA